MASSPSKRLGASRQEKLSQAIGILQALDFGPKQSNEIAGYALLSLLSLSPDKPWSAAQSPLRGITPIISFIGENYGVQYAPNTRETIRDEAVKYFVEAGLLLRNPDDPSRPTNSGKTVYQIEPASLALLRLFGTKDWGAELDKFRNKSSEIRKEIERKRVLARVPVRLPSGDTVTLSPGGQNPLMKAVIEEFCPRFVPGGMVAYIGDTKDKFLHLDVAYLEGIGVVIAPSSKMPDIIIHDERRNWLVLIEAVSTAGPVDHKRRKELKELFQGSHAGLVFVTAFETRKAMQRFVSQISWETEVWIAEAPDHLIHFNGERYLGPYPDVAAHQS